MFPIQNVLVSIDFHDHWVVIFRIFKEKEGALKFIGRHQIIDYGHDENLVNKSVGKMKGSQKLSTYYLTRSVEWITCLKIHYAYICLRQTAWKNLNTKS